VKSSPGQDYYFWVNKVANSKMIVNRDPAFMPVCRGCWRRTKVVDSFLTAFFVYALEISPGQWRAVVPWSQEAY
jgi:hypothetical protein